MKNKGKRILIGLVIPIIITTLFCVAFFYKNELKRLLEDIKVQEENLKDEETEEVLEEDGAKIVKLTKSNWDKYFEIEIAPELVWNDEGELEMMQYEITDATSGEWRLTKKQTEGLVIGGRDRMFLWWNSADTKDNNFVSVKIFECGEYMGNLVVEVPGEPQVQAAEGMLVLKK